MLYAASPAPVWAQAALIEDIDAPSLKLQVMDLLAEGERFTLAAGERITLSYFEPCVVEEIRGGTVTVGTLQSDLTGGRLKRKTVRCGGSGVVMSAAQERRSDLAGVVYRAAAGANQPVTLYARAPIFAFSAPVDELVIQRLDLEQEARMRFAVTGKRLDLADTEVRLAQGGTYRATAGDKSLAFKVSESAPETSRLISRFIGF